MPYQRSLIVMLAIIVSVLLSACQQSEAPPIDDLVDTINVNYLTYDVSLDQQWISPNPRDRWTLGGRELQVTDNVVVRIIIRLEEKTSDDFEEAMTTITAEDLTFGETETGERYARAMNEVGSHMIFRDYPDTIVRIQLADALLNTIEQEYIDDWERIALEGGLLTLE